MHRLKVWLAGGCMMLGVMSAAEAPAAITRDNFLVTKTRDLVVLCSAAESEPLYQAAIGFCHGYFVGAHQYHQAITPAGQTRMVCLPEPRPPRAEIIRQFVAWSSTHPQYDNDFPVDSVFRFLIENWACEGVVR